MARVEVGFIERVFQAEMNLVSLLKLDARVTVIRGELGLEHVEIPMRGSLTVAHGLINCIVTSCPLA